MAMLVITRWYLMNSRAHSRTQLSICLSIQKSWLRSHKKRFTFKCNPLWFRCSLVGGYGWTTFLEWPERSDTLKMPKNDVGNVTPLDKWIRHIYIFESGYWRRYGVGSKPMTINFSGMNIHLPAILMFTRGTWFWHTAIWKDKRQDKRDQTSDPPLCGSLPTLGMRMVGCRMFH